MRKDERPLPALKDAADLSGLALTHRDVEENVALCVKVVGAEELGTLLGNFMSLHTLGDRQLSSWVWRGM